MTLADLRRKQGIPTEGEHASHEDHHPGALEYLKIGAILAIVTGIEVGLYYIDMNRTLLVALLGALSIFKFSMVVLWFMHLKFDNRLLSVAFATGLGGTSILFGVVLIVHGGNFVDI